MGKVVQITALDRTETEFLVTHRCHNTVTDQYRVQLFRTTSGWTGASYSVDDDMLANGAEAVYPIDGQRPRHCLAASMQRPAQALWALIAIERGSDDATD